jgi:hypothetical protein
MRNFRFEIAFSARDINKLVSVEHAPVFPRKMVVYRMTPRRVRASGQDVLVTNRCRRAFPRSVLKPVGQVNKIVRHRGGSTASFTIWSSTICLCRASNPATRERRVMPCKRRYSMEMHCLAISCMKFVISYTPLRWAPFVALTESSTTFGRTSVGMSSCSSGVRFLTDFPISLRMSRSSSLPNASSDVHGAGLPWQHPSS